MSGAVGSSPINFSARMTWAELEIGNNSANPCTTARAKILRMVIASAFFARSAASSEAKNL